ncbi:MAG TPA: peptidylprolyl isomerase [Trebonia sp.]|nr:peptidylprolyl isomerase [Trebonia sp.]
MPGSNERKRRLARERYERQQQRRRERQRKIQKWSVISLAVIAVLGLAGGLTAAFAGGSTPKHTTASKATPTASPSASATSSTAAVTEPAKHCSYTSSSAGDVVKASLPPATPDYKATYTATINTSVGPISINLLNSKATCTVNSFVHLADANFWNNTQCHRISNSEGLFMLQCGDPTAKATQTLSCSSTTVGTGGPGYEFANENLSGAKYPAGTVAMANSGGSDTNGSQFFLVFKNTSLPADYTPFGTITSGLDILQNVAKAGTSCTYPQAGGGVPKEKVIIKSVTIKQV